MADGAGRVRRARICQPPESEDPMGRIVGIIVVVWLVIGVFAAVQRGYFGDDRDVKLQDDERHPAHRRRGPAQLRRGQPQGGLQDPEGRRSPRRDRRGPARVRT